MIFPLNSMAFVQMIDWFFFRLVFLFQNNHQ